MSKIKLFYSGVYACWHREITPDNIREKLKDDVRSKLVDNIDSILYYSNEGVYTKNPNVQYMGGFYYEPYRGGMPTTESVVLAELDEIQRSDVVVVNLLGENAIASITELIYAAQLKKRIEVFVEDTPDAFDVTGKYWFPIDTAKVIHEGITVHRVKSNQEVIDFILNLKE